MRIKHLLKTTALTALLLIGAKVGWGQGIVIYSTGFESTDGFTAGTTYNNTTVAYTGAAGQQWGTYFGTPSTTSPLTGSQSMQMRWYTATPTNLGYTFTNFDLAHATKVVFNAANTNGINVIVSYSTDGGTNYVGAQTFTLTTTKTEYTYTISPTGAFANVRIKFQITYATAPTATSRLYLDDIKVYGPDSNAPVGTFSPLNGATGVEPTNNITVSFNEPIYTTAAGDISDPTSLITFKETDASGVDVPFSATINTERTLITIDPTSNLDYNKVYYVAIAPVEDIFTNEQSSASTATFTTRAKYTTATVSSTDYTVTGNPTWTISMIPGGVNVETFEGKISSVENSTFDTYESTVTTPIATGTPVVSGDIVKVTSEDGLNTQNYTLVVTPALTAATTNNDVEHDFDITYPADATWQTAITDVKVNGTSLNAADWDKTAAGVITIKPTQANALLTAAGTKTITVVATGYADATVSQVVNPGAADLAKCGFAISGALALNGTTHVTLTAMDKYSNPIEGYLFKYDATITNVGATTESYTIDGVAKTASENDVNLTATAANGQIAFDVVMPSLVDGGDGISIQFQLADGNNIGEALSYTAPVVPAISVTASLSETTLNGATIDLTVLNDTFLDDVLALGSFTLNGAPIGVSISGVTYLTSTTATITLAYDGTDFDVNSTAVNVTVDASEFTANGTLTSNNLTITALVETAPVVTTAAAITTNGDVTATWEGSITSDGGEAVTEKGICWGTTADPTTADSKIADASVGTAITGNLTGLTANTTYHVRAYAINVEGTSYGEDRTFTTLLSSAKAIVSTTIGSIDETNKLVISVPATTTVADLKAALTVSPNATFEIYTAPAGTTAATGTTVLSTVKNYVIRVTAQNTTTQEYGIGLVYTETTIHDIQYTTDASGDSPKLNQVVKFNGIVTAIKGGSYQSAYVQDGTGEWSAVYAFSIPTTTTVALGDNVTIEGYVKEYNKLTEIDPVYRVTINSHGNALPEAAVVSTGTATTEAYESVLIQVKWAACTANDGNGTSTLNDGSGDLKAYKSLYSSLSLTVGNRYNVTGVMTWFNSGSIYELYPRDVNDISDVTGINDNTLSNITVYPNPFSNEIKFNADQNVKRVVISSITGQVVKNETVVGTSVNTESLPQGMYLVTLFNDKGEKATLKMIKQ